MRPLIIGALLCAACTQGGSSVRITVYQQGAPMGGARAWFGDPVTGEVIASGTTDHSGAFSARVPAGASASAAVQLGDNPPSWSVYTVLDTRPDDQLKLGDSQLGTPTTPLGSVIVTLPGPFSGAVNYRASLGCAKADETDPSGPLEVTAFANCLTSDGTLALLAQAFDPTGLALAYATVLGIEPPTSGNSASVTVGAWQTDFAPFQLTLDSVPAEIGTAQADLQVVYGGEAFEAGQQTTVGPAVGQPLPQSLPFPSSLATRLVWKQSLSYGTTPPDGVQVLLRSTAASPPPSGDTIDLSTDALPRISMLSGAIGMNGSPELSWQAAGDLSIADGMIAICSWINPNDSHLHWMLIGPAASSTTLSFPQLPDALKLEKGVLAVPVTPALYAVEADDIAGYDDFRSGSALGVVLGGTTPLSDVRVRASADGMTRF
jgi:hypothetical protein